MTNEERASDVKTAREPMTKYTSAAEIAQLLHTEEIRETMIEIINQECERGNLTEFSRLRNLVHTLDSQIRQLTGEGHEAK